MKPRIKHIVFVLLILCLFAWVAYGSDWLKVNGNLISVHADGMALGEVLAAVEDMTGIYFRFDESQGEKKVSLDFEDLPLSEGIKKIIRPLSSAMIYDGMGKLRSVIIIPRWNGLETRTSREEGRSFLTRPPLGQSDLSAFTTGGSDTFSGNKNRPSGEELVDSNAPLKKTNEVDEPSDRQDSVTDGPPLGRAYVMDGPPSTQGQPPEKASNGGIPDVPPPPDSGVSPTDGPPLDRPYNVDGPPDWKGKMMEGPPGAGGS
jgi:hypothetical protein